MAVIHFAAFKAVGESVKEPLNLDGMKVVGYTSAIQVFFLVLSGFIGLFVSLKMVGGDEGIGAGFSILRTEAADHSIGELNHKTY
jgi:hypothetical protein